MIEIAIRIEGRTPLLCNKFTDAAQLAASSGSRSSIANNSATPQDIAESKLYTNDDGVIGIPQPNLFRCLIDAGKFHKLGKSKVTTQKSSIIPAAVDIDGVFIPLEYSQPWKVDTRPVRIPATGGRILAHRPCFDDWALEFTANVDETILTAGLFRDIVDDGGSKIGLGDFRPDTKGPFGKYRVTSWAVK